MRSHLPELLRNVAMLFPAFLMVFSFSGFCRALVAKIMGDDTPRECGFLTVNPLAHVDIVGMSIILVVIFLIGGLLGEHIPLAMLYTLLIFLGIRWVYTVPFESRNFKYERLGAILTLLAGPVGSFLLTLIFLYILKYFPYGYINLAIEKSIVLIFNMTVVLGAYFGVLSLVPIPPFDGGRLLKFILPKSRQNIVMFLEEYSLFIILAIFLIPGLSYYFFKTISELSLKIVTLLSGLVF